MFSFLKKWEVVKTADESVMMSIVNFERLLLMEEIEFKDDKIYRLEEKIKDLKWLIKILDNKD